VLSGPNLAPEIAARLPAASVVASAAEGEAARWQDALAGPAFRVYRSTDVTGVEVAGAVKNVIALAAGAAFGREYGLNTVATIVTRGLAEMARLGAALGARAETFLGLAGVGDLTATCFSPLSRNRRMGELLALGRSPEEALRAVGGVVEGVPTAPVALELARRHGVEMPITEQVAAVLRGAESVEGAMAALLGRAAKPE
jgi:glycerol-3-phosphate dehydrogenase (NAD(P)+)